MFGLCCSISPCSLKSTYPDNLTQQLSLLIKHTYYPVQTCGLKSVLVIGKFIPGLQTVCSVIFYDFVFKSCCCSNWWIVLVPTTWASYFFKQKSFTLCGESRSGRYVNTQTLFHSDVLAGSGGVPFWLILKFPSSSFAVFLVSQKPNEQKRAERWDHNSAFIFPESMSFFTRHCFSNFNMHVAPQASCSNTELSR